MIKRKIALNRELRLLSSPTLYTRQALNIREFISQAEDFLTEYFGGEYEIALTRDYDYVSVSPRAFAGVLKISMQRNVGRAPIKINVHAGLNVTKIAIEFDTSRIEPRDVEQMNTLCEYSGHSLSITENSVTLTSSIAPVTVINVYAGNSKVILHALEEMFLDFC